VIKRTEIQKIVNDYDDLRIAVLGSHSALEIMDGAKDEGLDSLFFAKKVEKPLISDLIELLTKLRS